MSVLTFSARCAFLQYVLSCPLHIAVGTGDASWGDVPPDPEYEATSLVNEKGRIRLTQWFYVNEDPDGDIEMPGKRFYKQSNTPTRMAYLFFACGYNDAPPNGIRGIREVGVFINTRVKAGLPSRQIFFTPDQIDSPGTLLTLEHLTDPDNIIPDKRGGYETILTI